MLSESDDVAVGDSTIRGVISRRILSSLDTTGNVWVLSTTHATLGGLPGGRPDYTEAESEWAAGKSYAGVLKRLREADLGAAFESIKANYRELYGDPDVLDDAWLLETGDLNADGRGNQGWYFYAPLAGSEGKVWAQFPTDSATEKSFRENPPSEVTGVWVPAGSHRFDPARAGLPAGPVALVQTADYDREKFVDRQWSRWWGRFTVFVGCAIVAFSAFLFVIYQIGFSSDLPPTAAGGKTT